MRFVRGLHFELKVCLIPLYIKVFFYICGIACVEQLTKRKMADDKKIIFSMVGVSKTFNQQKKVLNNIYLSFFYGTKIGISDVT